MDATRSRRTRDCARQRWYAAWRSQRFARHLGFPSLGGALREMAEQRCYAVTLDLAPPPADQELIYSWELVLCSY